ncbi:MAG: sugar transferase [Bacteroidetes bacterium]|nr:sugar transferase [Bacteroidota bacterium]
MSNLYTKYYKRLCDIFIAVVLLFLFSPVFLFISLVLVFSKGQPIFFRQKRIGKKNLPFYVLKFRTMRKSDMSDFVDVTSDADRITYFGSFLRKTSFDEIPQLINVIKGEMSLVGPRPLLTEYLPLYNQKQIRRHDILPGITGWAQVNGRNAISWEKKFDLDVWYVDNMSFWLDVKILIFTLINVIGAKNINKPNYTTTEKFRGTI